MTALEIRELVLTVVRSIAALRPYNAAQAVFGRQAVTNANAGFQIPPGTYRFRLMVGEIAGVQTNVAVRAGNDTFDTFPQTGTSGGTFAITGKEKVLVTVDGDQGQNLRFNAITDGPNDTLAWVRIL